jgi:hypothetical protein
MVKLDIKQIVKGKDLKRADSWTQLILEVLGSDYTFIAREYMVGQFIAMFVKDDVKPHITQIKTSYVKTANYGLTGNKGCCSLRFNYYDSSFVFINVHLEHRQNAA